LTPGIFLSLRGGNIHRHLDSEVLGLGSLTGEEELIHVAGDWCTPDLYHRSSALYDLKPDVKKAT
jgi:hypothetical protein